MVGIGSLTTMGFGVPGTNTLWISRESLTLFDRGGAATLSWKMRREPREPSRFASNSGARTLDSAAMGTAIIITGMHRSGTSLLANLLSEAGIVVGDRLMEATEFNQKGYFEDLDFQEFHQSIIDQLDPRSLYDLEPRGGFGLGETHRTRAQQIIDARHEPELWGWKDPRTVLFLDFWAEVVPSARIIFIYRSAEQVVDSLRRRRDPLLRYCFPGARVLNWLGFQLFRRGRAIETWRRYNAALVKFAKANPDRACVVELEKVEEQLPALIDHMRESWGLPVAEVNVESVLDGKLLHTSPAADLTLACARHPGVEAVTAELRELSSRWTNNAR